MTYLVEVDEGQVDITRQGVGWWHLFSLRFAGTDRLRYTKEPCIVGGVVEVTCDDREHADWLAAHMVEHGGLPRTAVRVKAPAKSALSRPSTEEQPSRAGGSESNEGDQTA